MPMTVIEPNRLAEVVRSRVRHSLYDVSAYWIKVTGNREDFADSLRTELKEDPIVTLVVRETRFDNPNAILTDLVEAIDRNRDACEEAFSAKIRLGLACGIILLARTELNTPQVSSPVILPEWFPVGGGTTVSMTIEDLTWTAEAPLNSHESQIGEIHERLFALEGALLRRLERVYEIDYRQCSALLKLIGRGDERFADILANAKAYHSSVITTASFRPSVREGRSVIARLWEAVRRHNPEALGTPANALASALDLRNMVNRSWYESLLSALDRPSSRDREATQRFARNLLITVGAACQLVTIASHSDNYNYYPVPLTRSLSLDVRRSLNEAEGILDSLDD